MPKGIYIRTEETRKILSLAAIGKHNEEKNPQWKGDEVSYSGLHKWVKKNKGIPIKCEFCGKEKTTPKSIQWANKSRKYLRKLEDWISLCAKCHWHFDRDN